MITIYCKIKAIQKSQYTLVIAEDLNRSFEDDLKYVAVTLLPNWQQKAFDVDDEGYLTFESVDAGEKFFNRETNEHEIYRFTANYFHSFVPKQEKIMISEIKLD